MTAPTAPQFKADNVSQLPKSLIRMERYENAPPSDLQTKYTDFFAEYERQSPQNRGMQKILNKLSNITSTAEARMCEFDKQI